MDVFPLPEKNKLMRNVLLTPLSRAYLRNAGLLSGAVFYDIPIKPGVSISSKASVPADVRVLPDYHTFRMMWNKIMGDAFNASEMNEKIVAGFNKGVKNPPNYPETFKSIEYNIGIVKRLLKERDIASYHVINPPKKLCECCVS